MSPPSNLVTGAGGVFGTLVTQDLRAGGKPVIAGPRRPAGLGMSTGHTRDIDFADPASLGDGSRNINRRLPISIDALAEPQHQVAVNAAAVREVLGRAMRVVQVTRERIAAALARRGCAAASIPMVVGTEQNQRTGHSDIAADTTLRRIGRARRSIHDFLQDHAERLLAPAH